MKAAVTKPTAGIKMPKFKVQGLPTPPKAKHAPSAKSKSSPTTKTAVKLPTIPQHRDTLAGMSPTPVRKKRTDP